MKREIYSWKTKLCFENRLPDLGLNNLGLISLQKEPQALALKEIHGLQKGNAAEGSDPPK